MVIRHNPLLRSKSGLPYLEDLHVPDRVGRTGIMIQDLPLFPTAMRHVEMKATGEGYALMITHVTYLPPSITFGPEPDQMKSRYTPALTICFTRSYNDLSIRSAFPSPSKLDPVLPLMQHIQLIVLYSPPALTRYQSMYYNAKLLHAVHLWQLITTHVGWSRVSVCKTLVRSCQD